MIQEDYVCFEVAKLLKEKGFDEQCRAFYKCWPVNPVFYKCDNTQVFDYCTNSSLSVYNYIGEEMNIAAPTLQMACKWLREVHNLSVETFSIKGTSNVCPIFWKGNVVELLTQERAFSGELVYSYEEAVEATIKYTLENLI